jgi:hypothetical protein
MANVKISALTELTAPAAGDYIPIVDISEAADADKTKRILWQYVQEYAVSANRLANSASGGVDVIAMRTDHSWVATRVVMLTNVATTNDGSNYWTIGVDGKNLALSANTTISSANTAADSPDTWTSHEEAPDTASPGANDQWLNMFVVKNGSPGNLDVYITVFYRMVAA